MHRVAVMHGRLSPPTGTTIQAFPIHEWQEEFARARAAGLDGIEWIYDAPDAEMNPLGTEQGRERMRALESENKIRVWSCCADYFLSKPLVRVPKETRDALEKRLLALIGWAGAVGIGHLVLPFVDASAIRSAEDERVVIDVILAAAPEAAARGVELHLETDLDPARFAALLDRVPMDGVYANYDSGNSASLGYAPADEFAAYGARVGSVHLKDRVRGGGTVRPGTGNADFRALFTELERVGYRRDFTLQVARDVPGEEVRWLREQRAYFAPFIESLSRALA